MYGPQRVARKGRGLRLDGCQMGMITPVEARLFLALKSEQLTLRGSRVEVEWQKYLQVYELGAFAV